MTAREDRTKVIILTAHYRIAGEIAIAAGARLTDYIVDAAPFIAVVNAQVTDHAGREIMTSPFLNVHREFVEVIAPAELARVP